MATHGIKATFEVVGETQQVPDAAPPGQGFRFGRMFPELPGFQPTSDSLDRLGKRMTADPAGGNGTLPAGYTYFGQFIDHDITRDSAGGRPPPAEGVVAVDPEQRRSPSLDLDSVYYAQVVPAAFLDPADPSKLRIGETTPFPVANPADPANRSLPNDLPRRADGDTKGAPLIGDDRNDENLIVSQLHLAFLKFHNKVADALRGTVPEGETEPLAGERLLVAARRLVTKHYQWLVLNDFVNHLTDEEVFAEVFDALPEEADGSQFLRLRPKVFAPTAYETPAMPLEFSVAAYRLGHSMIRPGYAWNRFFPGGAPPLRGAGLDELFFFTHTSGVIGSIFPTLPSNWIVDWRRLFDFSALGKDGGIAPAVIKTLDTHLAGPLGELPKGGGNLASRNLNRGRVMAVPSGQAIADRLIHHGWMKAEDKLTPDQILDGINGSDPLDAETRALLCEHEFVVATPLWFYILREAALLGSGERLGPLGSRVMVETFLAVVRCSRVSIFDRLPERPNEVKIFSPEKDSDLRVDGQAITTMAHLLAFIDEINPLGDLDGTPNPPSISVVKLLSGGNASPAPVPPPEDLPPPTGVG